ncbi:MAG: reverse transcriptase family protein, partial [Candidatus Thiodiazotropha sp.]
MEGHPPSAEQIVNNTETENKVKMFKFITYNCKNMETALCAVETLSKIVDIILIQEHWYFDCQLSKLGEICKNLNGCGKAVDTGDQILPVQMPRGYGGVAILWKENIDHLVTILPDGGNRIQCVEVACQEPVILVSVYMPCRGLRENSDEFADCIAQLQEIYQKYSHSHTVIFGGDFNEDLGILKESERNKSFKLFMNECQLTTKETGKTYVNPDGVETSTIDYILFPESISSKIKKISRLDEIDANVSDHLPLMCTLDINLEIVNKPKSMQQKPAKVKWEKVDKDEYKARVSERLATVCGEQNSLGVLDSEIAKLNDILRTSANPQEKSGRKPSKKPKLKVWTPDIQQAIKEKKRAFGEWKFNGQPNTKEHWLVINKKVTTRNLRKLCRLESARQRQTIRQEILDARYEDTRLFHKLIKRQRGGSLQCVNELRVGDKIYTSKEEILDGFREHFSSLATPSGDSSFDTKHGNLVKMEVNEILDMCVEGHRDTKPVTQEQVKRAISSLNRGKAADIYGITAEHFLHGGPELLQITTDIINSIYRQGAITDCMKIGVLTPVYKKKGSHIEAKNYRGITILPIITKILESVLREVVRPAVEKVQNSLQRGFTQNSSPMNCSLILEEVVRESKDRKQPLYIAFLDVKAAFDVVSHDSLLRKLFHIGLEGTEWSLIQSLHCGAESVVKWEGSTSQGFSVYQGVRQGGILSTDLYKLYGNDQLDRIQRMGVGSYIGDICCAAPTTADDMALGASSLDALQCLVTTAVDNSKLEKYILQPTKSVILAAVTHGRKSRECHLDINISMDGEKMPVVSEAMHLGILRSADSQQSTVTLNIEKARRTTYCLMGAGLHGQNGLDPDTSIHVLQTYILPILVYGLEVLLPRRTLMEKAERFYKKLLKQILSLPDTTADPAVYLLTGSIPLEGVIHSRALTLFGSICRLDEEAVEKQVARRQLSVKGDNSCSWFVDLRNLLWKYELPSP